ncbi:collagen-binding domain-containing protein [Catellatospora tritici]|uniref:collagen-binding domain-containing protein n=1 Tax=Catellatospora tritici TaxID=2851566 RepID=UPI001C2DCA7C|nr:collagen-binding domain-containing protein [Catellatospora tritici]MBV1852793.1 choice-of-anchor A family protein [Catellatospora tritici]
MHKLLRGIVATSASLGAAAATMLLILGPAGPASAASPAAPTAAALGFDIFVEGNAKLSDGGGASVALGGDLIIGGDHFSAFRSTFTAPGDTKTSGLVVGGAVDFAGSAADGDLLVSGDAYAKIADLSNADVLNQDTNGPAVTHVVADGAAYDSTPRVSLFLTQPVASVGAATGIDFAAAFQDFRKASSALARCVNTIVLTDAQGQPLPAVIPPGTNAFLTLAPGVTNVLNISAPNLTNIATLTFANRPNASTPLLVNVDTAAVADVYDWHQMPAVVGAVDLSVDGAYALWNFPTATSISTFFGSVLGTLYAPRAALTMLHHADVRGQVIVKTADWGSDLNGDAELIQSPFAATLNCVRATTLTVTGPATVANGFPATLSGTLQETGNGPISGKTITFTLGSGASAQSCTGTTDGTGAASCTIGTVAQPATATSVPVTATFAGDGTYLPSTASATAKLVFYTGRAVGLSSKVVGRPLAVVSDTGEVSTSMRSTTEKVGGSLTAGPVRASGVGARVITGDGESAARAWTTELTLGLPGLPAIRATDLVASSRSTCKIGSYGANATGRTTIGSLTIGGINRRLGDITPNTVIRVGLLTITLNEQKPIPGASAGLTVTALRVSAPGVADVVVSQAKSDIHNCG